ncbi:UDP-4-amino-4,6-dideoxy-N-acetyl-beta-L-altrosamine transaminase [candidate division WWE3 bacterium CG10_big_fil_rev_8_21_14_0_10_32_10]|uniref:UDP-4-amino-4, 6-dideoxy-N-acetyl-beta-L-altrosamine transaminase n=1 Tax=candidate division WWE3 bacterium CG10_big_fil_rev_8_21_14_0_10_32_10 TaxID=1975090 RepID=A0A2H0RAP5_UNCKA|nr:MAG: UDP-4-amino-4,6-dideoxy-N-acetyl-beta-L-altrosamine transaminase [candidate division WWE3 bacterium CG10_big_fil_rev_8_21_14_0_10_32_10]
MNIKPREKFLPIATAVFGEEEKKEVIATMESGWITLGPRTKQFEEDLKTYTGAKYAIALQSCSAALHLALLAAGIGKGDEVITTTFTYAATVNAILHVGAKPVLVDVESDTLNIDINKIEEKITSNTKALLPVHYGGHPIDLDKFQEIARKHNILLIEDAAHAIGAEYKNKKIGTTGDMVCFSFHPVKNMTTGDGGAVVTNNEEFANKLMVLRVNGMDKESWKRNTTSGSWDYSITALGFKYHMNDIAAAMGLGQLKKLNAFIDIRIKVAKAYDAEFSSVKEITPLSVKPYIKHAHNLYPIMINTSGLSITRNQIMEKMKEYNVGSIVYYRPIHMHKFYADLLGYKLGDFPIAEKAFEHLICLPMYAGMTKQDAQYVADLLKEIITENKKK